MCPEKVDRLAAIDCSSPMSAKIARKTGSFDPFSAGTCKPAWAMAAKSPAVLSATVLPPVFGPAMISTRVGGVSITSTGITESKWGRASFLEDTASAVVWSRRNSNGCRAPTVPARRRC